MARQTRHRVHRAGAVGRHRRPRPGVARPGPGPRRWSGGRVARRHLRRHRDPHVAPARRCGRRARRRVDAGGVGDRSDLLPGDLPRPARQADAEEAVRADPGRRHGQRRAGRARLRHRTAVARLRGARRAPRVDRGPEALPRPDRPQVDDRRLDRRPDHRRGARAGIGVPHTERADRPRCQRDDDRALPRARYVRRQPARRRDQPRAPVPDVVDPPPRSRTGPAPR